MEKYLKVSLKTERFCVCLFRQ